MVRNRNAKRNNNSHPRPVDRKEGTLKRWNKPSDIPMDEEDQFHASRDRILLEGDDVHSDDEGDEEEVFALKGIPDSEEEDEGEVESEEDEEDEDETPLPSAATSKKPSGKQRKQAPPSSDEQSDSESEEEGWGRSKAAYYSSNAAQLSSDDEEANEMEEQEANRLQAKIREVLNDDDFGLADVANIVMEQEDDSDEPVPVITEVLPKDKESLLRHLERTNPEALALARDWDDVARTLVKTQEKITRLEDEQSDAITSGMLHLYYQALLQYAITLAFYLYLRSSEQYSVHPEQLRSHPIMGRLLTLKQHIATLEDLDVAGSEEEDEDEDEDEDSDNDLAAIRFPKKWGAEASDELLNLFEEMKQFRGADEPSIKKEKKKARVPPEEPPKKKRKTTPASKPAPSLPIFDLEEPVFPAKSKPTTRPSSNTDADAYGEQTTLQAADAADKAARKRTLRFHTSKIESASARRERARANAGGDDDIPWKERKKEREERQKRELEKSRTTAGNDLDEEEPESREAASKKRRRDEGDDKETEQDDAEGYYDLVSRKSKEKKERKKVEYETEQSLAREELRVEDIADGPRSVSRAIMKNRGLTPHRSKSVRNPRVKKRQRYEKAKKTVASQKAVYKGGVGATGRYDGEKSGISKVIKSVRL